MHVLIIVMMSFYDHDRVLSTINTDEFIGECDSKFPYENH